MPKVHQYVDGSGYYIKSSFKGVIVTYQVTPKGEQHLKKKRIGEGATITKDKLLEMQKKGYIYTGGSGPARISTRNVWNRNQVRDLMNSLYRRHGSTRTKEWSNLQLQ